MGKGAQITIAALSVFAGLAWVVSSSNTDGTFQFFENVAEFHATADQARGGLRVHGYVVQGTIDKRLHEGVVDFMIADKHEEGADPATLQTIEVRYDGIDLPDLFRDGAEVIIEGERSAGGMFVAQRVMAKCPSKYENAPEDAVAPDKSARIDGAADRS